MPGRSLTGEQRVVASELLLKFDDVTPQGALSSTLVDALQFFLKASQLSDTTFDATSEDAVTARRIAEYVLALVDERRRKDEKVSVGDIENLTQFLFPWRMKADFYYDGPIFLKEGNAFVDLIQRIQGLTPRTNGFNTIWQHNEHSFRPTIKRVAKHYHQTVREGDHQHIWAPGQLHRTYKTLRTVQEVHSEHHHLMTVRTGGYTLEREGGALSAYSGVLVLKYMGTPVSTVRFLPDPTNIGLLAGDAIGYHIETATAHGVHGGQGGSSGTSQDGYISSLSLDTQAGAGLGKITAIRSPDGTAITTAQSTADIHYTRLETDALIAGLQAQITAITSQHALDMAIQSALHTLRATEVADLQARCTALEAIPRLMMKLAPGATGQIVDEIHLKSAHFGGTSYYSQGNILYIQTSGPSDSNPH